VWTAGELQALGASGFASWAAITLIGLSGPFVAIGPSVELFGISARDADVPGSNHEGLLTADLQFLEERKKSED
jgi:hypothetical protein